MPSVKKVLAPPHNHNKRCSRYRRQYRGTFAALARLMAVAFVLLAGQPVLAQTMHTLPFVTPASNTSQRSLVRIVNRSDRAGTVTIHGIDDSGERFGPVSFSLRAKQTKHLDSRQLEGGATLSGGVGLGNGEGNWRLELETQLDIVPLAYIRGAQGFVTTMHDVVRGEAMRHHVLNFNKAPVSRGWSRGQLRLINPTDDSADVTITGHDDYGNPGAGAVSLTLPAGASRTLTAHQLEGGDDGFDGSLGDGGIGRWQLFVSADRPIRVMSLMLSPTTGYMTNLSSVTDEGNRIPNTNACDEAAHEAVDIPDIGLRAVVEKMLNKAAGEPITRDEMATLTVLNGDRLRIESLTGLECATGLTWLSLEDSQISDVSPLSGLTALTWLNLGGTPLVTPTLRPIGGNQISDVSPLSDLTALTWLNLGGNQISDVSPLSGLTTLTWLNLGGNQISDVSPLSGLIALTALGLGGNQISDVSPLSGLTALTALTLGSIPITAPQQRNLGGNQISDVSPLSALTALTWLDLTHNQISDISPLSALTALTWLNLDRNQISDVSPLSDLTALLSLSLPNNEILDVSPLSGLTALLWLDLGYNLISDISPLSDLTALAWLYLSSNPLSDESRNTHIPDLRSRGVFVWF